MTSSVDLLEPLRATYEGNRLCVPVPWQRGERLLNFLRRHGVGATLYLDETSRSARLVLWPDADEELAQAVLGLWQG